MASTYQVKAGDCISSIAFENGFFPDTIWDHPNNSVLKTKRVDLNVLMPGDSVYVPDKRIKSVDEATDASYKFKYKGVPAKLNLTVMYFGQPVENRPYTLDIDGRLKLSGQTGGDGSLSVAIPPNAKRGKLVVDARSHQIEIELDFGQLDPIEEIRGFKQRLQNLGYDVGELDDEMSAVFKTAIRRLETEQGMAPTGECNATNRAKLKEIFGR